MKVKCINNKGLEGILTLGKEYEVKNVTDRFFIIINDKGLLMRYCKDKFVQLRAKKEEVKTMHDTKLLEEPKEEVIEENYELNNECAVGINECTIGEMPLYETTMSLNKGTKTIGNYEELAMKIGQIVDKKNAQYGDAVATVGNVLDILYPNGIKQEQYKDLGVIVRILDKIFRITRGNQGEENAYMDIAGYSILMSKERA